MLPMPSQVVIRPGWEWLLRAQGLDTVAGVYACTGGTVFTRTPSTEVRRVELSLPVPATASAPPSGSGLGLGLGEPAVPRVVFIKKYWIRKRSQLWSGMFRGTFFGMPKVRREFYNLERLRGWGLDAPAGVAFGEERRMGWLVRSFLISEAVPDPVPLQVHIRDRLRSLPSAEARAGRRQLIDRLASYTRRLHGHRFVHHDYFWRNILLEGESLEHFHLIDAHKGRGWYPGEDRRARARDLAALDAPAPWFFRRTERLRFFLRYLDIARLDAEGRCLLRATLRLAEPQREKQRKRTANPLGRQDKPSG